MTELVVPDSAAMEALGARLAPHLRAGDVVLLDGELGAGKTTFTRGLGAALGARGAVTSPTFVLAREHPTAAGVPLVHVDAYRLPGEAELDDLDLDWAGAVTVVEWGAGKAEGLVDAWLRLEIARPAGGDLGVGRPDAPPGSGSGSGLGPVGSDDLAADQPRRVTVSAHGSRGAALAAALTR